MSKRNSEDILKNMREVNQRVDSLTEEIQKSIESTKDCRTTEIRDELYASVGLDTESLIQRVGILESRIKQLEVEKAHLKRGLVSIQIKCEESMTPVSRDIYEITRSILNEIE